jgi:tetratricopeptide (TPR) repeat protein
MYRAIISAAALLASCVAVAAADGRSGGEPGWQGRGPVATIAYDIDACRNASGEEGIAACSRLIARNPRDPVAYNNRALHHRRSGDVDRAIADLDRAIRLDPAYAIAWSNRCRVYNDKGEHDRAIADCDRAIGLDPRYARAWDHRGFAYAGKGDYDHAIADYDRAIWLDPDYAVAYGNRGHAYRAKRDYDRAILDYDQAIRLDPKLAHAWNGRGVSYRRKGDSDRAVADYDQAIRVNPANAVFYDNRGYVYSTKGDYDHAFADFDQAIRLDPNYARAWNHRGFAFAGKGDYVRAIADYDQALRLDQNLAIARQNRERAQAALAPPPGPASPVASGPPAAGPERRVALVIGNSQYRSAAFLPNPRRDAQAVADALRQDGFQSVELAMDLDRDGMVKALRAFRDQADRADWALVYYAGHGIEIDRINYLIPTDAKLRDDRDVTTETISYEEMLSAAGGARVLRIVVLDACRANPFKDQMRRTATSRSGIDRGLAPPPESKPGTLVVYAAKDGELAADDGGGGNSPFARAFVAELKVPGREVRRLFDYVRDEVLDATDNRQQPFTYGSLPGRKDFYFAAGR